MKMRNFYILVSVFTLTSSFAFADRRECEDIARGEWKTPSDSKPFCWCPDAAAKFNYRNLICVKGKGLEIRRPMTEECNLKQSTSIDLAENAKSIDAVLAHNEVVIAPDITPFSLINEVVILDGRDGDWGFVSAIDGNIHGLVRDQSVRNSILSNIGSAKVHWDSSIPIALTPETEWYFEGLPGLEGMPKDGSIIGVKYTFDPGRSVNVPIYQGKDIVGSRRVQSGSFFLIKEAPAGTTWERYKLSNLQSEELEEEVRKARPADAVRREQLLPSFAGTSSGMFELGSPPRGEMWDSWLGPMARHHGEARNARLRQEYDAFMQSRSGPSNSGRFGGAFYPQYLQPENGQTDSESIESIFARLAGQLPQPPQPNSASVRLPPDALQQSRLSSRFGLGFIPASTNREPPLQPEQMEAAYLIADHQAYRFPGLPRLIGGMIVPLENERRSQTLEIPPIGSLFGRSQTLPLDSTSRDARVGVLTVGRNQVPFVSQQFADMGTMNRITRADGSQVVISGMLRDEHGQSRRMSLEEAQRFCASVGGHLVTSEFLRNLRTSMYLPRNLSAPSESASAGIFVRCYKEAE